VKSRPFYKFLSLLLVTSLVLLTGSSLLAPRAKAAEATFGLVRLDRMKVSTLTGGTVCLEPSAADNGVTTVSVSFSDGDGSTTGYTLSATASDFDATVTDMPYFGQYPGTQATAFPGINGVTPAIGGTGNHTLTYTVASTDLSSGTVYCFNFGAGLTARGTAASDLTGTIATNGSSTQTAVYATASITEDQISVTATVPQIFNFSLSGTSIGLGNLSTTTVTSGNITATLGTNGKNGWVSWIKNSTNGLYSTTQSSTIAVPAGAYGTVYDLASTTGYVLDVDSGTGSPTVDSAYNGTDTNSGGILQSSFKQIAFKATPGAADTLTINLRAKVTGIQAPASDYADTLTIAAAGEF
jgi:hypothetical protein